MNRYALIDVHSGFVWAVVDAASALDSCSVADKVVGPGREGIRYERIPRSDRSSATYAVYKVPAGFDVREAATLAAAVARKGQMDLARERKAAGDLGGMKDAVRRARQNNHTAMAGRSLLRGRKSGLFERVFLAEWRQTRADDARDKMIAEGEL